MGDYISREAAIKYLNTAMFPSDTRYTMAAEIARNIIETIPAADVRPVVHGEWIAVDGEEQPCDEWDCSACKQRKTFMFEMDADDMKEYYSYCPSCGADMRGGQDNA